MKPLSASLIATACVALVASAPTVFAAVPTMDTVAQTAIAIDFDTGAVLYDKDSSKRVEPASLSKMMTAYVVYSYLKAGRLKLDDTLPVSQKAWAKHKTNESNMFVPLGAQVKVEDLVRGMMIQSGNDACVVLAEGIAGSTDAFVDLMNQTAQKLGLKDSHFADVDGLPDPEEYMTAHDIAMLGVHLIRDFPEYYHYDSEKEFTYNGIKQGNRNPLLYKDIGVDGLKTGHTEEAGYGVAISAIRNGRRIVEALVGMKSMNQRSQEAEKLLDWAYREWADYKVVKAGDPIDDAPVWFGTTSTVPATVSSDLLVSLPRNARASMKVTAVYDQSAQAPVAQGQKVGMLQVTANDMNPIQVPLVAAKPVDKVGGFSHAALAAGYL
ncbi:MAG TPA: D-alanyl-D-alanine carboxypeptidase family protein, partial [Stellaceae bacterium]|nr:D-alanyl-D-alanine carboxypeptidase family protein [Stellaceae bacterium]